MMKLKLLIPSLAIMLSAMVAFAQEVTVSYQGNFVTESPRVALDSDSAYPDHYQGVINYNFEAEPENAVCAFYATKEEAAPSFLQSGGDWRCRVSWDKAAPGLVIDGLKQRGFILQSGVIELPYSVYAYSGGSDEEHLVATGVYELDVLEPEPPEVLDAKVFWTDRIEEGRDQINHNPDAELVRVEFQISPRPYRQRISKGGATCLANPESENCLITLDSRRSFGDRLADVLGETELRFIPDSHNYFWNNQLRTGVGVEWDYRPPELEFAMIHIGHDITEPTTVNVGDAQIEVQPEEAILVVKSPHIERDGDWWKLANSQLIFEIDESVELRPYIPLGRIRINFDVPFFSWQSRHLVNAVGAPEIIGDRIVYRYDLSSIPDGRYNITAEIRDLFDNGRQEYIDNMLIDRFPPVVKVLLDTREIRDGASVYFTSDFTVMANGGWNDGSRIESVSFSGTELELECHTPYHCEITSFIDGLEVNSEHDLVVVAVDDVGNRTEHVRSLVYAPVNFGFISFPSEVVSDVQFIRLRARQLSGSSCVYTSSDESAAIRATVFRSACTIEWESIPDGMYQVNDSTRSVIEGVVRATGEAEVAFNVYYHNPKGDKLFIQTIRETINVVPPAKPELTISHSNRIDDNLYGLPFGRERVTRYSATVSPGAAEVRIHNNRVNEDNVRLHPQRKSRSPLYSVRGQVLVPEEIKGGIFERYELDVEAYYVDEPQLRDSQTIEVVNLPSRRVKAYLDIDENNLLSTEHIRARIMVGNYSRRTDELYYDPEVHGRYDVYIERGGSGEEDLRITEVMELPESGIIEVDIPANEIFEVARTIRAIAVLRSPHPEYSLRLRSMSKRMHVLKGEAVEGTAYARRYTGPVPFTSVLLFEYASQSDRRVASPITWEVSTDGVNWQSDEELYGTRNRTRVSLQEAGSRYVRARVSNIRTGEVTISEVVELVAYERPSVRISGPREVYRGREALYRLTDFGEFIQLGDGDVEWSFDNGETWEEGEPEVWYGSEEDEFFIHARYRYAETPNSVDEPAWDYSRWRVRSVDEVPVNIRPRVPRRIDSGYEAHFNAQASNPTSSIPDDIIVQWTMPDGQVLSGQEVTYITPPHVVPNGEYATFHVAAWVEGYKQTTYAERLIDIQVLSYEFPDTRMRLRSPIQIAPARVTSVISMDNVYAPGVRFDSEVILSSPSMELVRQHRLNNTVLINDPGLHRIDVRVFDNRDNEVVLTEFVEIVEAEPMTGSINLRTSNSYNRAPLRLSARVSSSPGHPDDRRALVEWFINGEYVDEFTRNFARLEIEEPGTYEVKARVTSRFGQVGEFTESVVVNPNKPPVCNPQINLTSSYVTFQANCNDEDGRIVSYEWWINGEERSFSSSFRTRRSTATEVMRVEFKAWDDSGDYTEGSLFWPGE